MCQTARNARAGISFPAWSRFTVAASCSPGSAFLLERARAGAGRLLLFTGEPGIGKSRLAEKKATTERCSVLWNGSSVEV
jgi:hypothetical protein